MIQKFVKKQAKKITKYLQFLYTHFTKLNPYIKTSVLMSVLTQKICKYEKNVVPLHEISYVSSTERTYVKKWFNNYLIPYIDHHST